MGRKSASNKKPGRRKVRGYLCAAFAAAVLLTGCSPVLHHSNPAPGTSTSAPAAQHVSAPGAEPGIITVFNNTGKRTAESNDPYASNWAMMLQDQSAWSKMPKYDSGYQTFLAQFNQFRGEALGQMATGVNAIVEKEITYNDTLYGQADDYWATPIETVLNRAGDCKDQTILQYFILRNLGVPDNRLFVADVNAEGKSNAPDHSILLLNAAPRGALPQFVVLNDAPPVLPADNAVIGKKWQVQVNGKWTRADFVFYGARNQSGFWETHLTQYDYMPAQKNTSPVRPNSKAQVARVNPPAFRRSGRV